MDIYFINTLIKKFYIDYEYARGICLDLTEKGKLDEVKKDIESFDNIEQLIRKYYKEIN